MKNKLNKVLSYGKQNINTVDIKTVLKALSSDFLTQGPMVSAFEKALCDYTGAKYAVAVSNGTAALHIACLAGGVGKGDEVITSPITFLASANCAIYCDAKPVFADIRPDTRNIDIKEIENKITEKTKALIPVHFAGHPVEMKAISELAKKKELVLIEDACHALGASYQRGAKKEWASVGNCKDSDMTVFSFHPVKSITTGEGGAILTNKKALYEKLVRLRSHGVTKDTKLYKATDMLDTAGAWYYEMQELGFNYRITDIQCALGISQLKRLDKFVRHRREIAALYDKLLANIDEIILPCELLGCRSSWHIYPICLKNSSKRESLFSFLHQNGIRVQVHYIPVHLQPYYREIFGYKKGMYPQSERYYAGTFSLPIYPDLKKIDVERVVSLLKKGIYEK